MTEEEIRASQADERKCYIEHTRNRSSPLEAYAQQVLNEAQDMEEIDTYSLWFAIQFATLRRTLTLSLLDQLGSQDEQLRQEARRRILLELGKPLPEWLCSGLQTSINSEAGE